MTKQVNEKLITNYSDKNRIKEDNITESSERGKNPNSLNNLKPFPSTFTISRIRSSGGKQGN